MWADQNQVQTRIDGQGAKSAIHHDGGSIVPAEEVNGDLQTPRRHITGRPALGGPTGVKFVFPSDINRHQESQTAMT